jgi:hypothetical protein
MYRCRSAFLIKIDRIPSFIIGHSIVDIHYSFFMPYAFPHSAREQEKVSLVVSIWLDPTGCPAVGGAAGS